MSALEELKILAKEALGTPSTEGLQELVDAIADYEARQALKKISAKE